MNDKIKEVVRKARDLISDKSRWTQGVNFKDNNDIICDEYSATKFCALGAIQYICKNEDLKQEIYNRLRETSRNLYSYGMIAVLNDSEGGYEKVMNVFNYILEN